MDVKWRSLPLFLVAYLVLNSHFFCLVQATFFDNYLRIRVHSLPLLAPVKLADIGLTSNESRHMSQ